MKAAKQALADAERLDRYWQAVQQRDASQTSFVYAVRSTGIYCRPGCPARTPKRDNITFYALPELAQRAGYRACKRCQPDDTSDGDSIITAICRFIEQTLTANLVTLSQQFDLSPAHLQKRFKQSVGVSPQAYLEACRMGTLKTLLRGGDSVAGASFEAGFGSSSRLYSRAQQELGMTPKTYKEQGVNTTIRYSISDSPLGKLLVAATAKGICSVRLADSSRELEQELRQEFSAATVQEDAGYLRDWVTRILAYLQGQEPNLTLPTDVRATAFQKRVWQALQAIPYGETRSYAQVAEAIGKPSAVRAVAGACAKNPTALVVPCHRVVRSDGSLSGYRWGVDRKKRLLEQEATP